MEFWWKNMKVKIVEIILPYIYPHSGMLLLELFILLEKMTSKQTMIWFKILPWHPYWEMWEYNECGASYLIIWFVVSMVILKLPVSSLFFFLLSSVYGNYRFITGVPWISSV